MNIKLKYRNKYVKKMVFLFLSYLYIDITVITKSFELY